MVQEFEKGDLIKFSQEFIKKKIGKYRKSAQNKKGVFIEYKTKAKTLVRVRWFGFKTDQIYHTNFIEKVQHG